MCLIKPLSPFREKLGGGCFLPVFSLLALGIREGGWKSGQGTWGPIPQGAAAKAGLFDMWPSLIAQLVKNPPAMQETSV